MVRRRDAERVLQLPRPPRGRRPRATRSPSTGRASRGTPGPSPTPSCWWRCRGSPTCCGARRAPRGDRVAIYMPMIPELPVAMLACTRIGAAHSVVFGGFSPDALARPDPRRRGQGRRHRRRRLAPGRGGRAEGQRRRGGSRDAVRGPRGRCAGPATRWARTDDRRPRPLVARAADGEDARRPAGRPPMSACRSTWTPRTCSSSSTPRERRRSPRASCIPPAAI